MDQQQFTDEPPIRNPSESGGKQMKRLKKLIEEKYNVKFSDYTDFQKWTVNNLCQYWAEFWDFFGIICSERFREVVDLNIPMNESPKWYEGARLNYAENLLRYRDDRIALIQEGENSKNETYTFKEMYDQSRLYAAAFRKFGLKKGDRVACYMSNRTEAIFAMHAVISIGAIWTGALPLIGSEAIVNRFKQVNPRVLITVDRFLNDGQEIDMLSKVKEAAEDLPSLERILIVASEPDSRLKDITGIKNSCFLHEFLQLGVEKDGSIPPMEFEQVSFSHPLFISYTSGTCGLPKAVVHGSGSLMGVANAYGINLNTDRDSVWISVSPVGWISWNIFSTLHFLGETLILYEGAPYFLTPTNMWDLVEKYKATNILLLPSIMDEFQKRNFVPTAKHDLSSLKMILSGGTVVKPVNYDFIKEILPDVILTPAYGSTEIMGILYTTEPSLPTYKAEMNATSLGTAVEVVDDEGNPVIGQIGEIVITKPIPNLCLQLWNDDSGSLYAEKYFSKYKGMFLMGDNGIMNPITKNWIICCRSDETLKQRGCRFGSSEIYNVVETFPEVRDSICVSQYNKQMDERAVLFLKMKAGCKFSEELVSRIRDAITQKLTVRHVPDVIIETAEIPYNLNDKKVEIVVKKIINNQPYSFETIVNPDSLRNYCNRPELQGF